MIEQNSHLQANDNNNFNREYAFVIRERLPILMKHSKHHQQYWQVGCKLFMNTAGVCIPSVNPLNESVAVTPCLSIPMSLHPSLKRYVPNQSPVNY